MSVDAARGVLFDLDGCVYQDGKLIPGAVDAIASIRDAGIPFRFVTNTTRKPRSAVHGELSEMGLAVEKESIVTAPVAAAGWLRDQGLRRPHLLLAEATLEDFDGLETDADNPDCVVVGDLGEQWDYRLLNRAFAHLMKGARLVAIQKNRYWRSRGVLALDAGPFVAALEYAADIEAVIVGKPSRAFFSAAAGRMGCGIDEVVMVGDDVESDVRGALRAGAQGILVRTGKYRKGDEKGDPEPTAVIDSVADLPAVLLSRT